MFAKQMLRVLAVVAVGMVCWTGSAQAAIIAVEKSSASYYYSTWFPVSATDLANSDQATFQSLTVTYPTDWNGGSYTALNNGAGGLASGHGGWSSGHYSGGPYPPVQTFTFDTTVNTYGYDITMIVSTSADRGGRDFQNYILEYHTVGGGAVWTRVAGQEVVYGGKTYTVWQSGSGVALPGYQQVQVTLTNLGLTQVDQLRFTSYPPTSGFGGCTAWAEIDVIGVASIPEPATMALLGLGGLGLILNRKRR